MTVTRLQDAIAKRRALASAETPAEKEHSAAVEGTAEIRTFAGSRANGELGGEMDEATNQGGKPVGSESSAGGWSCPFCGAHSLVKKIRCGGCHSLTSPGSLDSFIGNQQVDRGPLEATVKRLLALDEKQPDEQRCVTLGLALLNLGRFTEGIYYLLEASTQRPGDKLLATQVENLRRQLREKNLHSQERPRPTGRLGDPAATTLLTRAASEPTTDSPSQQPSTTPAPRPALVRRRFILLVDDSPTVQKLVTLALEEKGYAVLVASDGIEALTNVYEFTPDLILLDISMPRLDGYQLCSVIQSNERTARTPIVMFTSKSSHQDEERGRLAGAVDYLVKPVAPETLHAVLRKHLKLDEESDP